LQWRGKKLKSINYILFHFFIVNPKRDWIRWFCLVLLCNSDTELLWVCQWMIQKWDFLNWRIFLRAIFESDRIFRYFFEIWNFPHF
jgi:hypothetical protein